MLWFADALRRLAISADGKRRVTFGDVAEVRITSGPSMLREDNGQLSGYVYIDLDGRDAESYVSEAKSLLQSKIALPAGYELTWSGSYQAMERVRQRMMVVVPLTIALVILLLYWNTQSAVKTLIVLLAVPFSAVGAVWYLWLAGYHMSTGVWVGIVALIGVDAGTGVFMLMYLDLAYREAERSGCLNTLEDLRTAIRQGSATRIRPKFMTFATTCLGLLPILWGSGVGSDLMKRIAAPLAGGIFTSFLLELILYPAIYEIWRWHTAVKFRSIGWNEDADTVPEVLSEVLG